MRRLLCAASLAAVLLASSTALAAAQSRPYVVVYNHAVSDVAATTGALQHGLGLAPSFRYSSALKGFAASD